MTDNASASIPAQDHVTASVDKVYEYVVSWKWLLGGLGVFLLLAALIGGLYYLRCLNLAEHVLAVSQRMTGEADRQRAAADEEPDRKKREELIRDSYLTRENIANLLRNYNETLPAANLEILRALNEVLDRMYDENLPEPRAVRLRRIEGLIQNCQNIIQATPSSGDAFRYHVRIMNLEWERYSMMPRSEWVESTMSRAKTVFQLDRQLHQRENYDALRIITLIIYRRLGSTPYAAVNDIPYMDELLEKVYQMQPGNLDVSPRYAEFIAASQIAAFRECSSETLLRMSDSARLEKALQIIDHTVALNPDNPKAYLDRFTFRKLFAPRPQDLNSLDPDIQAVLKIDPENARGLLQAAAEKANQAQIARRDGNEELLQKRKREAEEFFEKTLEVQPGNDIAYKWYGDFKYMFGDLPGTIDIWKKGIENSAPHNEELIGHLALAQLEAHRYEDAAGTIRLLGPAIQDARSTREGAVTQLTNLMKMLFAMLNADEAREAQQKARAAQRLGQTEESRRFFALAARKTSDATYELNRLFGVMSDYDFVVNENSIFASVVPRSLMLIGQLMGDEGKWDEAARHFKNASRFRGFQISGAMAAANAYQSDKKSDLAMETLKTAVDANPQNVALRFNYTQTMFNYRARRNDTTPEQFGEIEEQLKILEENRDRLARPWQVDLRRVQLEMIRDSRSSETTRLLQAGATALRRFQELENKEFPESWTERNPEQRVYSDDLDFLSELAGIYSSLAALTDFDRVLAKLRDLPGGEIVYFTQRVSDALRRKDREGAVLIIEEAMNSDLLTDAQKQTFLPSLENLKSEETDSFRAIYKQMENIFDEDPNKMSTRMLFAFGNMAMDQKDFARVKDARDRLEVLEREDGTYWRYLQAQLMLNEPNPDFRAVRALSTEINRLRGEQWDMGFVLQAMIEEQYLQTNPNDAEAKVRLQRAYVEAIRCGSVLTSVWNRLYALYQEQGLTKEAQALRREAFIRDIAVGTTPGQFPKQYQDLINKIHRAILNEEASEADVTALQCISLAQAQRENPELIFALNLELGRIFNDAGMNKLAVRHLEEVAKRGGTFVYPLAVSLAKANKVDEGFTLILDELDRMPSSAGLLVPSMMMLLGQVTPSEKIFQRIDKLIIRIENGEPQVFRGTIDEAGEPWDLPFGKKRIRSMVIRFPDNEETPDASEIEFFPPDEEVEEIENVEVPAE